jgi:hypothetical protein
MLTLDNPKQQRTLAEIVATSVPPVTRGELAARLARVSRLLEQQQKFDLAVAAALDRIEQAKQLRRRIKRVAHAAG